MDAKAHCLAFASILVHMSVLGQDVQPRAFTPAPVGVNAFALAYTYSTGELLFDKTLPVENVDGKIHGANLAYSRTFGVFGLSGRTDVVIPFVSGEWVGDVTRSGVTNEGESQSRTGFADPVFRVVLNVVGAPAMTRREFAPFRPRTVVSAVARFKAPLGQYDTAQALNLGSNRWSFSPQIAVSHVAGRLLLEAHVATWFFTDNNEFVETSTLSQDPLLSLQAHVGYLFERGWWLAFSTRQSLGGAVTVDDGEKTATEANNRVGITFAIPIARRYALKILATTALTATAGNDYDTFGIGLGAAF